MTDWTAWRQCKICHASNGKPCTSRSGRVVGGQPDHAVTELEVPHAARRLRTTPRPPRQR